jgi:thioredoxin 1
MEAHPMSTRTPDLPTLTLATFDETVGSADRPVLIDIWGYGCSACVALADTLETLAATRHDLDIYQLNGHDETELALRYNVSAVPTLLLFDEGDLKGILVGARGPRRLAEELDELLSTRS